MANSLTGDFDAVVLVRVRILNGLLAALHRNGGAEEKTPSLLHSFVIPVGPLQVSGNIQKTVAWANAYQFSSNIVDASRKTVAIAPPGVFQAVQDAKLELERVRDDATTVKAARGYGQVQVSTPTVSFAPGATSEVTTSFHVRARFFPESGSAPLPEPIHGVGHATFSVDVMPGPGDKMVLDVTPSTDDNEFGFAPAAGAGLSSADAGKIAFQIRDALRNRFEPTTLELDGEFPLAGFKALGSGSDQTLALPVMLSGANAPGLGGVNSQFLDFSDHFGIAISREFLNPRLQPMLDSLESVGFQFKIVSLGITWATYTVSVSSATLAWKTGEFEVTVQGSALTGSIFPDYHFTVVQRLTLQFNASTQSIALVAVGDPTINGLPGFAMDTAKAEIKAARNAALAAAQSQINQALKDEVSLADAMSSFDGAAGTEYTSVEIQTQGVVLHGVVKNTGSSKAQIDVKETADGQGFTALHSWMPGGWIERYLWSWKEAGFMQSPWGGVVHTSEHEHTFHLPKPSIPVNVASICLKVMGTQVQSTGGVVPVEGGEVCKISQPSWMVATMPKWWDLLIPIWEIDPSPEDMLDDAILAHVNMLAHGNARSSLGANSIIHFGGNPTPTPLEALGEALAGLRLGDLPVALCLVLPRGAFADRRAEVEKRLGAISRDLNVWLTITEDYEGRWARAFAHEKGAATYALNARGEFVWQHAGPPDARSFAELERHLIPGRELRYRQLRLSVRTGDRAPDFLFPLVQERRMALRRLRGRRVLLSFFKSWSKPCQKELHRLQRLHEDTGGDDPVILAISNDREDCSLEELGRELGLAFTLVPDSEQVIAQRYGVPCWPTTVSLDEHGVVESVDFGVAHGHRAAARTG